MIRCRRCTRSEEVCEQGKVNPAFGAGHSAQGSFLPQLFLTYLCKSSF